jgi:hypothetical protein
MFVKSSNIKFHENPSRGRRIVAHRTDRQTDMTNLTVAIRNFAEVPEGLSKTQTFDLLINSDGLFR